MDTDILIDTFTSSPDHYNGETTHYLLITRHDLFQVVKEGENPHFDRWYRTAESAFANALEDWTEDALDEEELEDILVADWNASYADDLYQERMEADLIERYENQ